MGNDDAARDSDGKLLIDSQGKKLVRTGEDAHALYGLKVEVSLDEYVRQLPIGHRARLEYDQLMATIALADRLEMRRHVRAAALAFATIHECSAQTAWDAARNFWQSKPEDL